MKRIAAIILMTSMLLLKAGQAGAVDENEQFLYGFLAGDYWVIGKEANGDRTYSGRVVFADRKDHLDVARTINGVTVYGEAKIEPALLADESDVLRVRFVQDGRRYEITYLWRSDLDNYARLSGYVYEPDLKTDTPGLEALFRITAKK